MRSYSDNLTALLNTNGIIDVELYYDYDGEEIIIRGESVVSDSMILDESCVTGTSIEIGTANASEFKVQLVRDDNVDSIEFYDKEFLVNLRVGTGINDHVNLGDYIVTDVEYDENYIHLTMLDEMIKLDKPVDWSQLESGVVTRAKRWYTSYNIPTSVQTVAELGFSVAWYMLLVTIGSICYVSTYNPYKYDTNNRPIITDRTRFEQRFSFKGFPNKVSCTYRDLVRWIAAATGRVARITKGTLELVSYVEETDPYVINSENAYSLDIGKDEFELGGFKLTKNGQVYESGDGIFKIDLTNNPLLFYSADGNNNYLGSWDLIYTLNKLYNVDNDFSYRRFSATILGDCRLQAGDKVLLGDDQIPSIVTNVTHVLGASTYVEGKLDKTAINTTYTESSTGKVSTVEDEIQATNERIDKVTSSNGWKAPSSWTSPFKNYSDNATEYKIINGVVYLTVDATVSASVTTGASNTAMFTLPVEARPDKAVVGSGTGNGLYIFQYYISTTGVVYVTKHRQSDASTYSDITTSSRIRFSVNYPVKGV